MRHTVYFRKADGKGTQVFLRGLTGPQAGSFKQALFDRSADITMCWVLDDKDQMLGDALTREPADTTRN